MTNDPYWDGIRWVYRDPAYARVRRVLRGKAVDHIDGNPYNNDPANLRIVDVRNKK